jgi:hypothetical protein
VEPCNHGAGAHEAHVDARGSAPENARGWLLIEHSGPWAAKPLDTEGIPAYAYAAAALGIRLQLIRRPGKLVTGQVYCAWTAEPAPWIRRFGAPLSGDAMPRPNRGDHPAGAESPSAPLLDKSRFPALARGEHMPGWQTVEEPMYLVCTHGRRDACCGGLGSQLARTLAAEGYPVWETTHVGGHRFAPNFVILPHGLYYGPVDAEGAVAAIEAHRSGVISVRGFRGRAGIPTADQVAAIAQDRHLLLSRTERRI